MQAVIDSGKKVEEKEIVYLTEVLMRQLLNLDGIEAEGEGRLKRKTEVSFLYSILLLSNKRGIYIILTLNFSYI